MKVDVVPAVNELKSEQLHGKSIVVLDVLRSSSTIISAFVSGCNEVIPVETSGQAYSLKNSDTLLAGERYCRKIQGFDFSNSPVELKGINLKGKRIVLSTTNGTSAMHKAQKGDIVLIGSFLNGSAVASEVIQNKKDLTLLCAGTRNEFALEDFLCAGFILSKIEKQNILLEYSDYALLAKAAFMQFKEKINEILPMTTTGKRLANMGLFDDLSYCAQMDVANIVPYLKEESIFVHPFS